MYVGGSLNKLVSQTQGIGRYIWLNKGPIPSSVEIQYLKCK